MSGIVRARSLEPLAIAIDSVPSAARWIGAVETARRCLSVPSYLLIRHAQADREGLALAAGPETAYEIESR